jgi:hypothetical protein
MTRTNILLLPILFCISPNVLNERWRSPGILRLLFALNRITHATLPIEIKAVAIGRSSARYEKTMQSRHASVSEGGIKQDSPAATLATPLPNLRSTLCPVPFPSVRIARIPLRRCNLALHLGNPIFVFTPHSLLLSSSSTVAPFADTLFGERSDDANPRPNNNLTR